MTGDAQGKRRERRRAPDPLTAESLRAIAIRYVERYQTSEALLLRYLQRKLRERGADGLPDEALPALVADLAGRGYVNDEAFAAAKARSLLHRGLGERRVRAALHAGGIRGDVQEGVLLGLDPDSGPDPDSAFDPWQQALLFARRKRLGPFGPPITTPKERNRQLGAFFRGGHAEALARRILAAASEEELQAS